MTPQDPVAVTALEPIAAFTEILERLGCDYGSARGDLIDRPADRRYLMIKFPDADARAHGASLVGQALGELGDLGKVVWAAIGAAHGSEAGGQYFLWWEGAWGVAA